jgi:regulator of nonsense transcripts 1
VEYAKDGGAGCGTGRKTVQSILARDAGDLFAFDFGPLAMALYADVGGSRVFNAVDIQSAFPGDPTRQPLYAIKACLGSLSAAGGVSVEVWDQNIRDVFKAPFYLPEDDKTAVTDLASRAWIAAYIASNDGGQLNPVKRIDTVSLPEMVSSVFLIFVSFTEQMGISRRWI